MPQDAGAAARSATSGPAGSRSANGGRAASSCRTCGRSAPGASAGSAQQLVRHDCAGIVIADPVNLRYATDAANMQVWCLHNPARYAFVATEGPVILFDFHGCAHLSAHLELVDEVRPARAWYYFNSGARVAEHARRWAAEIALLVRAHGGGNRRLAVDKADRAGIAALEAEGLRLQRRPGGHGAGARVKSADEIRAMRCAIAACEAAMAVMRAELRPGISEQELWAHLHAENVKRGGEWIETRLLASGPRTNPWFQECSSRTIQAGDLVGFDTDLIGPYGYCADISRTWLCGDERPTARQRDLFRLARAQIAYNLELVRPGLGFREFSEKAFRLPERYRANRYSAVAHGVGLCDEYPAIYYPEDAEASGYDGLLEAGMTICIESYIGEEGGPDGVKLEEQILITEGRRRSPLDLSARGRSLPLTGSGRHPS